MFLAQTVNFVILMVILYFAAYKPIINMLDQRSAKIKESMDQSEAIKQQTSRVEEEIKAHIKESQKEGEKIISQSMQIGEKMKEEARKEARQEAESMITKAKAEINIERDKTIEELRKEFVDIAITAAEKVIKETLDKDKNKRLIDDVMKESEVFLSGDKGKKS